MLTRRLSHGREGSGKTTWLKVESLLQLVRADMGCNEQGQAFIMYPSGLVQATNFPPDWTECCQMPRGFLAKRIPGKCITYLFLTRENPTFRHSHQDGVGGMHAVHTTLLEEMGGLHSCKPGPNLHSMGQGKRCLRNRQEIAVDPHCQFNIEVKHLGSVGHVTSRDLCRTEEPSLRAVGNQARQDTL